MHIRRNESSLPLAPPPTLKQFQMRTESENVSCFAMLHHHPTVLHFFPLLDGWWNKEASYWGHLRICEGESCGSEIFLEENRFRGKTLRTILRLKLRWEMKILRLMSVIRIYKRQALSHQISLRKSFPLKTEVFASNFYILNDFLVSDFHHFDFIAKLIQFFSLVMPLIFMTLLFEHFSL